ncbi:MAG TPA: hypothetical protein VM509_10280 [Planctomycetota bacterium]|nr:hypothetical protein [Planctomycetota bacterium]
MRTSLFACLLLASTAIVGCAAISAPWGTQAGAKPQVQKTAPVTSEAVLYARDGSVVTESPTNAVPRREMQGSEGSRTKILELYQRVVEERDRLQLALAERESELSAVKKALETEASRTKELESRASAAVLSSAQLAEQNLDLAGRLAQAQIRRLEAEKQWLELSLALPAKTVAASTSSKPASSVEKTQPAASKTPEKPAVKRP